MTEAENKVVEEDEPYVNLLTGSSNKPQEPYEEKSLGVIWDSTSDKICFRFDSTVQLANSLPATKRNLLRVVSTVFNPLGMVSPLVTPTKVCSKSYVRVKLVGMNC